MFGFNIVDDEFDVFVVEEVVDGVEDFVGWVI